MTDYRNKTNIEVRSLRQYLPSTQTELLFGLAADDILAKHGNIRDLTRVTFGAYEDHVAINGSDREKIDFTFDDATRITINASKKLTRKQMDAIVEALIPQTAMLSDKPEKTQIEFVSIRPTKHYVGVKRAAKL